MLLCFIPVCLSADLNLSDAAIGIDSTHLKSVTSTSSTNTTTPAHVEPFSASGGSAEEAKANSGQVQLEFKTAGKLSSKLEALGSSESMSNPSNKKRPRRLIKMGGSREEDDSDSDNLSSDSSGLEVVDLTLDIDKSNKDDEDTRSHAINNGGGKGSATTSSTTGNINVTRQREKPGEAGRNTERRFAVAGLQIPPFRAKASAPTVDVDLAGEDSGSSDSDYSKGDSDGSESDSDGDGDDDFIPFLKGKSTFEHGRPRQAAPKTRHGSLFGGYSIV